ncbi:probable serine/threonine-protein kinase SIS8 isoform X1 [Salvia hispanica]|uniref:probable serine/threonine-protein kinase SIS8 isoform X1 n=1 Tax=Salvia hispanica TaxID=49212 RepID=UPI002009B163|nr:probable serine/threonine-protein kinase SIS8 isoform X1 [Salvia hispanica]
MNESMKQNRPIQEHEDSLSDSLGSNTKHSTCQTKEIPFPGFSGEVFRGVWNGTEVSIKLFLEQDLTAENMEDFCNEISILSRLRHPNVILFLGACTKPPRLSLITEYMEMGSLYYLIHLSGQKNKLSWRRRIKMLRDICRGLMCIHRMKIIHHDLKSANCLVSKHWTVKICNFGLSRIMTDAPIKSSSGGKPERMAPEVIRNELFTEKCDIFCACLGCPSGCKRGFAIGDAPRAGGQVNCRYESRWRSERIGNTSALRTILCAPWFAGEYEHSECTLCAYVKSE